MDTTFRDVMSTIPTSVSIIATYDGIFHSACTVSSIVSVSISDQNPEILFVLKKNSVTGEEIQKNTYFSVSILSNSQVEVADFYSKPRDMNIKVDRKIWNIESSNLMELNDSKAFMECELLTIYKAHLADIYVAKILDYKVNKLLSSLIYNERKYGSFHPNSQK